MVVLMRKIEKFSVVMLWTPYGPPLAACAFKRMIIARFPFEKNCRHQVPAPDNGRLFQSIDTLQRHSKPFPIWKFILGAEPEDDSEKNRSSEREKEEREHGSGNLRACG